MEIKNGFYRHFKGGYVLVLFTAKHSDREEVEVVYKGLNNGKFYARPLDSFVQTVKNEQGEEVPRLVKVEMDEVANLLDSETLNQYKLFCGETPEIELHRM